MAKKAKLLQMWTESPEKKQEKELKLDLSAAEISAKGDLLKLQKQIHEQEQKVSESERLKESYTYRVGKDWSPAMIVNAEIELEEAQEVLKQLKLNEKRILELMEEYL